VAGCTTTGSVPPLNESATKLSLLSLLSFYFPLFSCCFSVSFFVSFVSSVSSVSFLSFLFSFRFVLSLLLFSHCLFFFSSLPFFLVVSLLCVSMFSFFLFAFFLFVALSFSFSLYHSLFSFLLPFSLFSLFLFPFFSLPFSLFSSLLFFSPPVYLVHFSSLLLFVKRREEGLQGRHMWLCHIRYTVAEDFGYIFKLGDNVSPNTKDPRKGPVQSYSRSL